MNKNYLAIFLKFIRLRWYVIVAVISVFGMLVFTFIPQINDNSFKLFACLGINAIVWILIDIKLKFDDTIPITTERYDNMRDARPHILEHIFQCMQMNKSDELYIEILGGRIRVTTDIMREIKTKIEAKKIISRNIKIRIYTINPDFMRKWDFVETQLSNSFKEKNKRYASLIENSKSELLGYNELKEFISNNIKIEVKYYDTYPSLYFYKIGNEHIYWGLYSWNKLTQDFVGPENPCYYLEKKHSSFKDFYNILSKKVEFYQDYKNKSIK